MKLNQRSVTGGLVMAILVIAVFGLTACDGGGGTAAKNPKETIPAKSNQPTQTSRQEVTEGKNETATKFEESVFLKILILQDKSGSTMETRTPQLNEQQNDTAIGLIRDKGGEIAFGLVNTDSNQSLQRVRIEIPPVAPRKPNQDINPWQLDTEMAAYNDARVEYLRKLREWEEKRDRQVEDFKAKVAPLLNQKPNARATDIFGGLQRASLFLSESEPGITVPIHGYVILISDGEDNLNQSFNSLPPDSRLLIINGSASIGSLKAMQPLPFESIEAALRFIAATEKR